MRTAFVVGIFGLALAAAGTAEWASRRAVATTVAPAPEAAPMAQDAAIDRAPSDTQASSRLPAPGSQPLDEMGGGDVVLVLGGSGGGFRANAQSLSEAMIDAIDLVFDGPDAAALACAAFVIEGHADNLGSADVNRQVALSRAMAVRRYLAERYEIPRDAMRIVSYGGDRPVGDNATPEGRAANRRVVIRAVGHTH